MGVPLLAWAQFFQLLANDDAGPFGCGLRRMRILLSPMFLLIAFVCMISAMLQANDSAEADIRSVMAEARKVSLEGDSAKIAGLMTDDYIQTDIIQTDISGHVQDKETWLKEYFNPIIH